MVSQCLRIIESQAELIKFLTQGGRQGAETTRLAETSDEMQELFDEELAARSKEKTLEAGKKVGSEPVRFPVKPGGGYVTNQEVEDSSSKKFKKLSRADELDIIRFFKSIIGMCYWNALGIVEEQGYTLHPVYINDFPKNPAQVYSGTTLGVYVKDSEYDGELGELSLGATIIDIVDVGGKDEYNRGRGI